MMRRIKTMSQTGYQKSVNRSIIISFLMMFFLFPTSLWAQKNLIELDMMFWAHCELYNTIKQDIIGKGLVEKSEILTISYENNIGMGSEMIIIKALPKTDFKPRPNLVRYKGYLKIKDFICLVRDNVPESIAFRCPIRYPLRIFDTNSITSVDGVKEWYYSLKGRCIKLIKKQLQW